jgi:hypothetical protein
MSRNFTQLYLHCVWGTWDRLPLVTRDIQDIVYAAIAKRGCGCGMSVRVRVRVRDVGADADADADTFKNTP